MHLIAQFVMIVPHLINGVALFHVPPILPVHPPHGIMPLQSTFFLR